MKSLKFENKLATAVARGEKTTTWRINDDKNITVDDTIECINSATGEAFGTAHVDEVILKRLGEVTADDYQGHEQFDTQEEMYETYRRYYGRDIGPRTHIKIVHFTFTPYKKPQTPVNVTPTFRSLKLYADGGSRGNPGPSAAGYVLLDLAGNVVKRDGTYLGITTNNQAEYQALKAGLEGARLLGAVELDVYLDSMLVVNQMKGIFKVKNRDLWPIHESLKEYIGQFKSVRFTHIPRELNQDADAMVNEILDQVEATAKAER